MTQSEKKRAAARSALAFVDKGSVIGVGTGSTANEFIDGLGDSELRIDAAVASSEATADRLRAHGIAVIDLDCAGRLSLYVDGADEATHDRFLIKGGGGALTREKIVAAASERFICIVDDSKIVEKLGAFPLPVEVIPMARAYVASEIASRGGCPKLRRDFVTDNGNLILDVSGLRFDDPSALESDLNQIAGVVTNGLFCRRAADLLIVGGEDGVITLPA